MYPKLRIYIYHLTLFTDSSVAEKYSNVSTLVCVCVCVCVCVVYTNTHVLGMEHEVQAEYGVQEVQTMQGRR